MRGLVLAALLVTWVGRGMTALDGDTFHSTNEDGPRHYNTMDIRLRGVQAPEIGGKARCEAENIKGLAAKELLQSLLDKAGTVQLTDLGLDSFNPRIDATVLDPNGASINAAMLGSGLATTYPPPKNWTWCP